MEVQQPIWRQALKDSTHPLHQATWLLFSQTMTAKGAAKILAAQREEVTAYLLQIVDTPELYLDNSFGAGYAPANAIDLLGEWRVLEAVPRMLEVLRKDDWESIVYDRAVTALQNMGAEIIDTLIAFAAENKNRDVTIASIVGKSGAGDEQVFEWLSNTFQRQKQELDVTFMAEILLSNNLPRAIEFLDDQLKRTKFSKVAMQQIQGYLKDARDGKWTY